MAKTFLKIFRQPLYFLIATIVFVSVAFVAIESPNFNLIFEVFKTFGFVASIKTAISLLGSLQTNFTLFSATYTLLIALFFGINMSLFVYYYKKYKHMKKLNGVKTSTLGIIAGTLGIGCASCGSLVIAGLFSVLGIGGVFDLLLFGGQEFAVIGLILLMVSTYYLLKNIHKPVVCKV